METWVVLCFDLEGRREDNGSVLAAHGPFYDLRRAEVWARQHTADIAANRMDKCPAKVPIYTQAVRVESLT